MNNFKKCKKLFVYKGSDILLDMNNCYIAAMGDKLLIIPNGNEKAMLKRHHKADISELTFEDLYGEDGVTLISAFKYMAIF